MIKTILEVKSGLYMNPSLSESNKISNQIMRPATLEKITALNFFRSKFKLTALPSIN